MILGLAFVSIESCKNDKYIAPSNGNTPIHLNISLQFPEMETYDSAIIVFKNSIGEIKQKLIVDNSTHIATGQIANISPGEWTISTSYYQTIKPNQESFENKGSVDLLITSTTTDLISNEAVVYIKDKNEPVLKSFHWIDFYFYQLYIKNRPEGFVRLPKDPINPFIEIYTYTPKWVYGYFDRVFYNSNPDSADNFVQGVAAGEIYGTTGETKDRIEKDFIDSTSLVPGIGSVKNKIWNKADCLVILDDYDGNEIVLYHIWDLRNAAGGRVNLTSCAAVCGMPEIRERKRIHSIN